MNSRRLPSLLSVLFVASATAAEPPSFPDLSGYGFADAITTQWLYPHRHQGEGLKHKWEPLLAVAAFHEHWVVEYFTGPKGQNYSQMNTGMGLKGTMGKELKAADLARLQELLRVLPATNTLPPKERLVLLSHRDGTKWITRAFDAGNRPKPLAEIFQLIGEYPSKSAPVAR